MKVDRTKLKKTPTEAVGIALPSIKAKDKIPKWKCKIPYPK
uniref:HECT, UBA and WWE domain containing 1 n=1 Tax=Mus musculus TaxID=10090 RepID=D6RDF2_MOUSE